MQHHDKAIAAGIARFSVRPGTIAILLIGSLARGEERIDSDVDLCLITSNGRSPTEAGFAESASDIYEKGLFDVKVLSIDQVRLASRVADDQLRSAFNRARVLWTASAELERELAVLLDAIARPEEERWVSLQAAFISQAAIHAYYYVGEGEKLGRRMMMHHGAVHFAFAVSRAILALNRVTFAGPKYLQALLECCSITLPHLVPRLLAFLEAPTANEATSIYCDLWALTDWPIDTKQILSRYIEDNEFVSLTGIAPPEYR